MRGIKRTIWRIMLAGALRGVPGKHNGVYPRPLRQRVLITHSHPFHNQHSHSTDSLNCHRPADALQFGHAGLLRAATPDALSVAGDGKRNRYARHKGKSVSDALFPRSPLFRYPLIVLYQRLVCSIPTLGIRCTDAWYSMYQSLVLAVPMFGIRRTCLWYLPYQVPVQNWYH